MSGRKARTARRGGPPGRPGPDRYDARPSAWCRDCLFSLSGRAAGETRTAAGAHHRETGHTVEMLSQRLTTWRGGLPGSPGGR